MIPKTAIIISGKYNTGKTTKISILSEKFINSNAETVFSHKCDDEKETVKVLKYRGKYIAFISPGDFPEKTRYYHDILSKNCSVIDIWVCACRTRGSTFDVLIDLFKGFRIIVFSSLCVHTIPQKNNKALEDDLNETQAEQIFGFIKKEISEK